MIANILVPVLSLAIIFAFVGWLRYMRHLEYRAYYEALGRTGTEAAPPEEGRSGVVPPPPNLIPRRPTAPRERLRSGVITAAVGAALFLGLLTLGVGPWLIAGLVPLFVGLVEMVFALLEPAR